MAGERLNRAEVLNELWDIRQKGQAKYEELEAQKGSPDELRNLWLAKEDAELALLKAINKAYKANDAQLEEIATTIDDTMREIEANKKKLANATKAVKLMAEFVKLATALAEKVAMA